MASPFCLAGNDSILDVAAEITSQARESVLHSADSLQGPIGQPVKKLEKHNPIQEVTKSHQDLDKQKSQDFSLFSKPAQRVKNISSFSGSDMVEKLMDEASDLNQGASLELNQYHFHRAISHLTVLSTMQESKNGQPDFLAGFPQSCYPKYCCFNPCSEKDRHLLEARLALRTHYLGKYCSRRIYYAVGSHCIEETRTYCVFPSVKARQVQEQGRQQINKLAQTISSAEHNAVVEDLYWPFKARVGRWHRHWVGNVEVAVWSWSVDKEDQAIFAICQYAEQCGALALPPFKDDASEDGWLLIKMPLEQTNWHWVSSSVYLRGKCIENQCHWQIKSMGVAGVPDTITSDLEWYEPHPPYGTPQLLITSTGIQIRPGLQGIQFKLPGKQPWRFFALPALIQRSSPGVMHENPRVLVWGACEVRTGHCHYYFSHQVNVHAILWGTPEQPNCRGLRPEELLWINWNGLRL